MAGVGGLDGYEPACQTERSYLGRGPLALSILLAVKASSCQLRSPHLL
jgi:hypothetical protein